MTLAKPEFVGVQFPGLARGCERCGKVASLGKLSCKGKEDEVGV